LVVGGAKAVLLLLRPQKQLSVGLAVAVADRIRRQGQVLLACPGKATLVVTGMERITLVVVVVEPVPLEPLERQLPVAVERESPTSSLAQALL